MTWRKETLPVTPENTPGVHVSLDKQHLIIQSGKLHHSGTYICTAVNEVSRKEREFYVSVLGEFGVGTRASFLDTYQANANPLIEV